MYKILCKACDFKANSTLPINSKKCPCCGKDIDISIGDSAIPLYKPINLPKPKNKTFEIEVDGCKLLFKEIPLEQEMIVKDHATYTTKETTFATNITFEEVHVDELKYKIGILAQGLYTSQHYSFLAKYNYLHSNFSYTQLDFLYLRYMGEVRRKYQDETILEVKDQQEYEEILNTPAFEIIEELDDDKAPQTNSVGE